MNQNAWKILVISLNIYVKEIASYSQYLELNDGKKNWHPSVICNFKWLFVENIRKYKVDLNGRCNGRNTCLMDGFVLPEIYINCQNKSYKTTNIDLKFTCKPQRGEFVHVVKERNHTFDIKKIKNTSNQVHYLIYNNTRGAICEILSESDIFDVTLLYVQWDITDDCQNSKEYVSIQNNTYKCNTIQPVTIKGKKSKSIKININKRSGLVWTEFKVSKDTKIRCDFRDIEKNSSTVSEEIDEIILLTVIPASVVIAITVTCLVLYRCGVICKSTHTNKNDILTKDGSAQENVDYNSTIKVSGIQDQRISQSADVYSDIDAKSSVKNANCHQLEESVKRSDDEESEFKETADTYAIVRKVQRTPIGKVESKISSCIVTYRNTSSEVSDDYAHFGQVQGRTCQTENVYNG